MESGAKHKMRKSLKHNLTRIALVEAIIKASECYQTGLCFCEYCAVLIDLSDTCGIDFSVNRRKALVYLKPALLGTKATDALSVLSIQHSFQTFAQSDIFAGFMELPEGAVESYEYYSAHRHEVDADDNLLKRQTAFILVSAALPDSYLDQFSNKRIANHIASVGKGWEQCCEGFSSINMPILDLPASITDNIEVGCFWTNHFNESGCLSPVAGYGLEFGLDRERLTLSCGRVFPTILRGGTGQMVIRHVVDSSLDRLDCLFLSNGTLAIEVTYILMPSINIWHRFYKRNRKVFLTK